jgi:hypothetical protein
MEIAQLKELCQQPTLLNVLPSDVVSLLHPFLNCEFVIEEGMRNYSQSGYTLFGKKCGKWESSVNGKVVRTSIHSNDRSEICIDWVTWDGRKHSKNIITAATSSEVTIRYDKNIIQISGWCHIVETATNKWLYKMTQGRMKFLDVIFINEKLQLVEVR